MITLPEHLRLIEKDITGSTNSDALELAASGAAAFTTRW